MLVSARVPDVQRFTTALVRTLSDCPSTEIARKFVSNYATGRKNITRPETLPEKGVVLARALRRISVEYSQDVLLVSSTHQEQMGLTLDSVEGRVTCQLRANITLKSTGEWRFISVAKDLRSENLAAAGHAISVSTVYGERGQISAADVAELYGFIQLVDGNGAEAFEGLGSDL